jgi:hypothetical protein
MNTPKHATDAEIEALFDLLPDLAHDVFEQRRRAERPAREAHESQAESKVAQNG